MPDEFDVFLSHNSRDKPAVEEIATLLRDRGLRVWLDKDQLRPGLPWQEGLEEGVRTSRSVAVFVGEDGMGAWQQPEMRAFLARARREEIPVIPVLLPGCPESPQLSLFLEAMTWVDLRDGLTDEGLGRLVWGITGTKSGADHGMSKRPGRFSLPKTSRPWWSWGIALSLLGVLLMLAVWLWRSQESSPAPSRPVKEPEIWLRGLVVDESGRELAGVRVSRRDGVSGDAITDSRGRFAIRLPDPAEMQIRVRAELNGLAPKEQFCFAGRDTCSFVLEKP